MILRPKTLSEMPKLLRSAQAKLAAQGNELKSIVMVGRHDAEATDRVALSKEANNGARQALHKSWEEHGAVVIQIPHAWTPENFWYKVRKGQIPQDKIKQDAQKIPHDHEIVDYLNQNGFAHLPFVNFHATQYAMDGLPEKNRGIGNITTNLSTTPHNLLSVEWNVYLNKKPKREINPDEEKQLTGLKVHGQLSQHYLTDKHPRTGGAIERFKTHSLNPAGTTPSQEFKQLLAHLAKNGLKK